MRPSIFITADSVPGLRSLADLRAASQAPGLAGELWQCLLAECAADRGEPPIVPSLAMPGRGDEAIRQANPDYYICAAASRRLRRHALYGVVTGDPAGAAEAWRQLTCLFDATHWPIWRDHAHKYVAADLRTGMLASAVGLTFDWLYHQFTEARRQTIIAGLERLAFEPFRRARAENAWYLGTGHRNNWQTVVVGGLGTAALCLRGEHPEAAELAAFCEEQLAGYHEVIGPAGEFNESVGYAGSLTYPIAWLTALQYARRSASGQLHEPPWPAAVRWYASFIVPPGRLVACGDVKPEAPPQTALLAAMATAARDPVLQHLYLYHRQRQSERHDTVSEFLDFDPTLAPLPPAGRWPLGQAFHAHSQMIISRADWDLEQCAGLVWAKGGHGREGHGHHDAGMVALEAGGEKLLVDLASPSEYPKDFFGTNRYQYCNAAVRGHNTLWINEQDLQGDAHTPARFVYQDFDERLGGAWVLDLTPVYRGVTRVQRAVIHLLPGLVAVLDSVELPEPGTVVQRWHTAVPAAPDAHGAFAVRRTRGTLSAQLAVLDGPTPIWRQGHHEHRPGCDRGRLGGPLEARCESFVETVQPATRRSRLLSLFQMRADGQPAAPWQATGPATWHCQTPAGLAKCVVDERTLELSGPTGTRKIRV